MGRENRLNIAGVAELARVVRATEPSGTNRKMAIVNASRFMVAVRSKNGEGRKDEGILSEEARRVQRDAVAARKLIDFEE